jgi:hypothetical protein
MSAYTYRMHALETGFLASCCELTLEAEGSTESLALAALEEALLEYFRCPNGMAPPSREPQVSVTLTLAPPRSEPGPQGPGEAP